MSLHAEAGAPDPYPLTVLERPRMVEMVNIQALVIIVLM